MANTGCDTTALRRCIEIDFPATIYRGNIFPVRYAPSSFEDEGDDLNVVLRDMTWRDIPRDFIETRYDEYLLMGDEALPMFLAAWLWVAVEDLNGWNEVRNWLAYGIAQQGLWKRYLTALSDSQREVIRHLLVCAKASPTSEPGLIEKALKSIDQADRGKGLERS